MNTITPARLWLCAALLVTGAGVWLGLSSPAITDLESAMIESADDSLWVSAIVPTETPAAPVVRLRPQ